MAELANRRSPLQGWSLTGAGLQLRELPHLAQLTLRGEAGLLPGLPTAPNTTATIGELRALWLGPDEWLLIGPPGREDAILAGLTETLAGRPVQVVDVTASRTTIEITGVRATELLSKGCGLDLHLRAFPPGRCAQTLLARAGVILDLVEPAPVWRVLVRASLARYLADWLAAAAAEYRQA